MMGKRIAKDEWDSLEWLHVYGQYTWHADATLRGTKEGLLKLRAAIDAALESGKGEAVVMASDGEGYRLQVICVSTHALLGEPEYIHETYGRLMQDEADRARKQGFRDPFGPYKRVDPPGTPA